MKKFLNISLLLLVALSLGLMSCNHEEKDFFDESAAERLENSKQYFSDILVDQGGKWQLEYFTTTGEPGYIYVFTFQKNGTVTISGENKYIGFLTNPDNKAFKEKEGAVVTVYFDGSELSDGDYVVKMTSSLAVGTDAKSYKAADMDAKFSIKDGKVTAVAALTAEAVAAGKAIYTVDGKKVAAPAKGQIYVVDGKAVKF